VVPLCPQARSVGYTAELSFITLWFTVILHPHSPHVQLRRHSSPSHTRPACWSLLQKAFRAPPFVLTSHTCSVPFDPPAAIVSGSSGDHDTLKTLPYTNVSGRTWYKVTEHTIPRSLDNEADMPLPAVLVDVPNLHNLVSPASHQTSSNIWIDVKCRYSAIMSL
jgi:hypothetical protein